MIENRLKLIPLSEIHVIRSTRQRSELTPESVYDLACSIARHGLLQNIGIKTETNEIIFGERRFTALELINKTINNTELSQPQHLESLKNLAEANPLYDNWTKAPVRIVKGSDNLSQGVLEFIENVSREDLPWQDRAAAAYKIHKEALKALKQRNETAEKLEYWTDANTADLLGISPSYFNNLILPLRELETASEKTKERVKAAVKESKTARSATNAARSIKERHGESNSTSMRALTKGLRKKSSATAENKKEDEPEVQVPLICADFNAWAHAYEGRPFNFIHCDFPYGVDFNKAGGQNTSVATKQTGQYDDSEEVYWTLLATLLDTRERLLDESAHIMFWLSVGDSKKHKVSMLSQTCHEILNEWPDAEISGRYLIWHCSDNSGLLPAPDYEGRRTYEMALQISLGRRKLAKPKALSFAHPRNIEKIHRSQKHIAVLNHFFSMYVDDSSHVLDPTCGSATSIVVAKKLGATRVLGIEQDPEMFTAANSFYKEQIK